jgi:hypothetical protein
MDGCRRQQRRDILSKSEEPDASDEVRLLGASSDSAAITRVARVLPSIDVSDDIEGHADIGSP